MSDEHWGMNKSAKITSVKWSILINRQTFRLFWRSVTAHKTPAFPELVKIRPIVCYRMSNSAGRRCTKCSECLRKSKVLTENAETAEAECKPRNSTRVLRIASKVWIESKWKFNVTSDVLANGIVLVMPAQNQHPNSRATPTVFPQSVESEEEKPLHRYFMLLNVGIARRQGPQFWAQGRSVVEWCDGRKKLML